MDHSNPIRAVPIVADENHQIPVYLCVGTHVAWEKICIENILAHFAVTKKYLWASFVPLQSR